MGSFGWSRDSVAAVPATPFRVPGAIDMVDTSHAAPVVVQYQPILDVARGVPAGYQVQISFATAREVDLASPGPLSGDADGLLTAAAIGIALDAFPSLPANTFLAFPLPVALAGRAAVRSALLSGGAAAGGIRPLAGVVLELVGPIDPLIRDAIASAIAPYRAAGALISIGGHGAPQPEMSCILQLRPAMLRLGRDWVRDLDTSPAKRSALETIGAMAGHLDTWVLAEGVTTAAELTALAALGVPMAQGSFIGEAHSVWPGIAAPARSVLPRMGPAAGGELQGLVRPAYTATSAAAVTAILPETTGVGVVVVVDEDDRPVTVIELDGKERWGAWDALTVNVGTRVQDVLLRAMTRPRSSRFAPLVCTDDQGRMLGVLRLEDLISHVAHLRERD